MDYYSPFVWTFKRRIVKYFPFAGVDFIDSRLRSVRRIDNAPDLSYQQRQALVSLAENLIRLLFICSLPTKIADRCARFTQSLTVIGFMLFSGPLTWETLLRTAAATWLIGRLTRWNVSAMAWDVLDDRQLRRTARNARRRIVVSQGNLLETLRQYDPELVAKTDSLMEVFHPRTGPPEGTRTSPVV